MAQNLSAGYPSLSDLLRNFKPDVCPVHTAGVVHQYYPPQATKGTDYQTKFLLIDEGGCHIGVKFFQARNQLPTIAKGDIVIVRNLRTTYFNSRPLLLNLPNSQVYVFSPAAFSSGRQNQHPNHLPYTRIPENSPPLTAADFARVSTLREWSTGHNDQEISNTTFATSNKAASTIPTRASVTAPITAAAPAISPRKSGAPQKFSLLKNVLPERFYDLVVELRKFDYSDGRMAIYATDYTENPEFFNFLAPEQAQEATYRSWGDSYREQIRYNSDSWAGPYGRRTIRIRIHSPHKEWFEGGANVGDILLIKNVRIHREENYMAGSLHGDRMFPKKVLASPVIDENSSGFQERVELEDRKKRYWDGRDRRAARYHGEDTKSTRNSRKKALKNKHNQNNNNGTDNDSFNHHTHTGDLNRDSVRPERPTSKVAEVEISPYIRCANPKIPLTTLTDVLRHPGRFFFDAHGVPRMAPFLDIKYRSRVRVVDFDPPDIRDFARCLADRSYNPRPSKSVDPSSAIEWQPSHPESGDDMVVDSDSDSDHSISSPSRTANKWEWAFRLLVEDAGPLEDEDGTETGNNRNSNARAGRQGTGKPNGDQSENNSSASGLRPGKPRLELIVSGPEAVFLLNMDPTDLRKDRKTLQELEKLLFTLWGNLAEIKADPESGRLSNLAFDCCIMEYGVRIRPPSSRPHEPARWVRCQKIFQTTIKKINHGGSNTGSEKDDDGNDDENDDASLSG